MHSRPVPGGERSVSPVVGTVLFVAIVVILGAVAAAFAFGLSDDPAVAPQTAFGFEYDADTDAVTLEVKQGDAIDGSDTRRLVVRVDGGSGDGRKTWAKRGGGVVDLETDALAAGDSLTVDDASGADTGDVTLSFEMESGDTVEVLWVARDGDETATIARDTVPSLGEGGFLGAGGTIVVGPVGAVAGDGDTGGGSGERYDLATSGALALGSTGDVDGDGRVELPYVDSSGALKINDSDGEVQTLVSGGASAAADTDKTLMAVGSWNGSSTSVLYAGDGHEKIYRVTASGSPTEVADLGSGDGVNSVLGVGDIDGDGADELVYAGDSQEIRYLESDGTRKTTGFTSGSSTGIGNGPLWDWDGDGREEAVVVDGSNDIRLIDSGGADGTKPAQSSVNAAKSPVTVADVDGDGTPEIVYLDDGSSELEYIDDVGGSPTVKSMTDASGSVITGDKSTGVVS